MNLLDRLLQQLPAATREVDLLAALQNLIDAPGWDETQLVVEHHPELLTELAISLLAQLAMSARGQGSELAAQAIEEHGKLLERCQQVGVAQAVAEWSGLTGQSTSPLRDPALLDIPAELQPAVSKALLAEQLYAATADPDDLAQAAVAWGGVLQEISSRRRLMICGCRYGRLPGEPCCATASWLGSPPN